MAELTYTFLLSIAKGIQHEITTIGLDKPRLPHDEILTIERTILDQYDELITHKKVRNASSKLFADGHYARAVEAGIKAVVVSVKNKTNLTETGAKLMRDAFSVDNPVLYWSERKTTSEKDEQRGYMHFYMGAVIGIRNPRAHELELEDKPETALELLTFTNHLMHKLDAATNQESSPPAS